MSVKHTSTARASLVASRDPCRLLSSFLGIHEPAKDCPVTWRRGRPIRSVIVPRLGPDSVSPGHGLLGGVTNLIICLEDVRQELIAKWTEFN